MELEVKNTPATARWVIGPFFQSFKSKMASFSEIVLSPVKLFTAKSPPGSIGHADEPEQSDLPEVVLDQLNGCDGKTEDNNSSNDTQGCEQGGCDHTMTPPLASKGLIGIEEEQHLSTASLECSTTKPSDMNDIAHGSAQINRSMSADMETNDDKPVTLLHHTLEKYSKSSKYVLRSMERGAQRSKPQTITTGQRQGVQDVAPDSDPMLRIGKVKRRLKLGPQPESSAHMKNRKRLRSDKRTEDPINVEVIPLVTERNNTSRLKELRNDLLSNIVPDLEIKLNPPATKGHLLRGMQKKGKSKDESLSTPKEPMLHNETENSTPVVPVDALEPRNIASENFPNKPVRTKNPRGTPKKHIAKFGLRKPDIQFDSMDLETTVMTTLMREANNKDQSNVLDQPMDNMLCRPQALLTARPTAVGRKRDLSPELDADIPSSRGIFTNVNDKPAKRGVRKQARPNVRRGTTIAMFRLEPMSADLDASMTGKRRLKTGVKQPLKRPKKDCNETDDQSHADNYVQLDMHHTKHINGFQGNRCKRKTIPAHGDERDIFLSSAESFDHGQKEASGGTQCEKVESSANGRSVQPTELKHGKRSVKINPSQRIKCRLLCSEVPEEEVEERDMKTILKEEMDFTMASTSSSAGLLRSISCPEIHSLLQREALWPSPLYSPQPSRSHASHHHHHQQPLHDVHQLPRVHCKSRRTRRHTVSSVEVAREIAPLCLRKEVYPSRRSGGQGSGAPSSPFSLSALASCFLTSPLAFLSRRLEGRGTAANGANTHGHQFSPSPSAPLPHSASSSSTSSVFTSSTSPASSSSSWHLFPGFHTRTDTSAASVSPVHRYATHLPLSVWCEML
ncbi:hypothetical protein N1851_004466 [Merluccius polli]|uniref:Tantalus-like domain-containing protein n=1 Tax=Merluccius polli TaxID=89951 RepID=A0AA47N8A8_MERPO|nr:hypothetical protein N1851_004466 [Merluccius polli]